uniref:Fucosyltransferase n=1 Tax=Scophthalmus maximus TaxID=52904 RepID=A0A8D2ZM07_SCOMX
MSFLGCQTTFLRQFAFGCLVVFSFVLVFSAYYKPEIKWPTFGIYMEKNCSSEFHISPPHNGTQKIQAKEVEAEPDTILLVWMWPFGYQFDLSCDVYNITGCQMTADKSLYHKAHGVLLHHRDIRGDLANLPKEPRPWFQKWVWFNMESPANTARIPQLDNLINLTCSYRLDSNIPVPYGYLAPRTTEETFQLPAKDKLVCWIVSNWHDNYKRVQYYKELKNHINISTFGNAFGQHLSDQDYTNIVSSCKFYLSFENSVYDHYITEKLYKPMTLGTVPIVLGPPRKDYEDITPSDSFIHVEDFSTPMALAERLLYLDETDSEYMAYFNWKNKYTVRKSKFGLEHACTTCRYLRQNRGYQSFRNLNKWFWG